ncbi:hypothetical protein B0H14DRAFT_3515534 [Mycena olivaceomarginata]|nr:hypothetical protein B0H14DRAFT_3515534 [Mycena olivaceomarginata]
MGGAGTGAAAAAPTGRAASDASIRSSVWAITRLTVAFPLSHITSLASRCRHIATRYCLQITRHFWAGGRCAGGGIRIVGLAFLGTQSTSPTADIHASDGISMEEYHHFRHTMMLRNPF